MPNIHALSAIQTHDPSVSASEDVSCLKPRGRCDRCVEPWFEDNINVIKKKNGKWDNVKLRLTVSAKNARFENTKKSFPLRREWKKKY
jgi:hypothetical protein